MNDPDVPAPVASPESTVFALLAAFGEAASQVLQGVTRAVNQALRVLADAWNTWSTHPPRRQRVGRAHPRPRNTRILAVQAKRKRLGLPQDGRLPGLSRKASYAQAQAQAHLSTISVDNLKEVARG